MVNRHGVYTLLRQLCCLHTLSLGSDLGGCAEVLLHLQGNKFEVSLHVQDGAINVFTIRPSTLISSLIDGVIHQAPCNYNSQAGIKLMLDGDILNDTHTAEMYGLEEGDRIHVMFSQLGD